MISFVMHDAWQAIAPLARRGEIARRLAGGQPVVSAALASEFAVSEDAIRRDLRALAAEGGCRGVYGRALPVVLALSTAARMSQAQDRKQALALAAAQFINRVNSYFSTVAAPTWRWWNFLRMILSGPLRRIRSKLPP